MYKVNSVLFPGGHPSKYWAGPVLQTLVPTVLQTLVPTENVSHAAPPLVKIFPARLQPSEWKF